MESHAEETDDAEGFPSTKKMSESQDNDQEYQEYLLKISPQERAKLEKEGLGLENKSGIRVDREVMGAKTLQEIQAEKLEKLMARVDVPLEPEVAKGGRHSNYRPPRIIGPKLPGFHKEKSGNDYHKYRTINKKKLTRELVWEKIKDDRLDAAADQARREEIRALEEERTAKKRAKRQRKKENNSSVGGVGVGGVAKK